MWSWIISLCTVIRAAPEPIIQETPEHLSIGNGAPTTLDGNNNKTSSLSFLWLDYFQVLTDLTAIARWGPVTAGRRASILPLASGHIQTVASPVKDRLDLLLVRALVLDAASVGVAGPGPGLLPVGLHHAAQVGGLVGHVLLQQGISSDTDKMSRVYQIWF